jgi:hypothetical protein
MVTLFGQDKRTAMKMPITILLWLLQVVLFADEQPLKDHCTRLGISGRIVDASTGKPVFGAKVWFEYQFMTSALALRFPGEAVTDAEGRFRVPSEFRKSKYLYGVTDDPSDPAAWKPDVPIKIQVDHPGYETFCYDFPTKAQNRKVPYLRQTYPIFTDGADYKIQQKK